MKSYGKEDITDLDRWTAHNVGYGNWRRIQKGDTQNPNLLKAIRNQAGSPQDVNAYVAKYGDMFHGGDKFAEVAPEANVMDQPGLVPNPTATAMAMLQQGLPPRETGPQGLGMVVPMLEGAPISKLPYAPGRSMASEQGLGWFGNTGMA